MGASVADSGIPFLSTIEGEYQLNLEQAKLAEADAKYNAGQRRRAADQLMGEQIAAFGASGVELEGTPMQIIEADQKDAEIEALNILYSGKMQAAQMKRRAHFARTSAYTDLGVKAAQLAMGMPPVGAPGASSPQAVDSRSTGTNSYTMSDNSSSYGIKNKGLA